MARPAAPRGQGRDRVVDAALELFGHHGVSGTSLQMIADHLGVTKAAVYYQFKAKEDIALAVLGPAFRAMRDFVGEAEAAPTPEEAADRALTGLVDLIIDQRQVVAALFRDPEVQRIVHDHEEFQELVQRLGSLLAGPDPDARRRVATSVLGAGLAHAGMQPDLADIDDATLRQELLRLGRLLWTTASPSPAV